MTDKEIMQSKASAIFAAAADRMSLRAVDAPRLFGVTRQTFSNWKNKETKVPPWAFIRMVEIENERHALEAATAQRRADIAKRAEEMNSEKR